MARSDIAFGSEFSPEQVDLAEVLAMAAANESDRARFLAAIQHRWYPKAVVAKNLPLSLRAYGLIEWGKGLYDDSPDAQRRQHFYLTEAGKRLLKLRGDKLYDELARHIMLHVAGGMAVVQVIEDMTQSGVGVRMPELRDELARRGFHVPKNGMHATRIRQWLEKAGVVTGEPFRVDEARKAQILGLSTPEIEALAGLTKEQKAYARALARMNVEQVRSNEVSQYATMHFGVRFPDTGLTGAVLEDLKSRGLIEFQKTTGGRGAKPSLVRPTQKLRDKVFESILDMVEQSAGMDYRLFVRMPMPQILQEIKSDDKHVKGKALDALAAKIAFHLGLEFVSWRLRSAQTTGRAEVDVIFQSTAPVYLRWNIQCKNTDQVRLDDVAKEVGLAYEMASNVVLIVSTGRFSQDAREHARHVMARTNLDVILIDGRDLTEISKSPAAVVGILERAAKEASSIKKLEIEP